MKLRIVRHTYDIVIDLNVVYTWDRQLFVHLLKCLNKIELVKRVQWIHAILDK